jgi:hypothetical protein
VNWIDGVASFATGPKPPLEITDQIDRSATSTTTAVPPSIN